MDKDFWRETLRPFTVKSNKMAYWQIFSTFALYVALWLLYLRAVEYSAWMVFPFALVMAFFVLRFFVLMHDCGHNSLFKSSKLNKFFGFCLGVITGMPQHVWSKHHAYHHKTNGDWERYQGPLSIITAKKYLEMTPKQQKNYKLFRNPFLFVSIGGFIYVLFNPRFNWMVGVIRLGFDILKAVLSGSFQTAKNLVKEVPSKKWKTPKEFRHMSYNNITLLSLWAIMVSLVGAFEFFSVYVLTLTLSGGLGILFFTVQHNFENSYASDTANTDYYKAALEGTSYLKLPALLNWFTVDIAYHHIHHLSTAVPNYQLKKCHNDLKPHFKNVRRISLKEIPASLRYLLWDEEKGRLASVDDYKASRELGTSNNSVHA